MSIKKIWAVGSESINAEDNFGHNERHLLKLLSLTNNAIIETNNGKEKAFGDPTESAIIRLLSDKHITKESLDTLYPRIFEIPFDSERKLMTTVHELENMGYVSITKGAFDRIPIDAKSVGGETAERIHNQFAEKTLRVIAVACKYYDELPEILDADELEHGLTLTGLVGMIDPPRPESVAAVNAAKNAGIKTVMITGDHVMTASAIACEIGILSDNDKTLTGTELEDMSDEELIENIRDYAIYARVSPEDKIRIVKAWQSNGEVVAMTGDGVNDAPALKAANVGVAMGIAGTDVAKNVADMILTDDNFATIIDAVAEGRRVYENIRKTLYSLLSCNISEIFIMILAIMLKWGAPVVAVQLLSINVVADGIPDFCLSREQAEEETMQRQPIKKNASIFADGLAIKIGFMAASYPVGQTMAFVIIGWSSVINIFNVRSKRSIFSVGLISNKPLFICVCISLAIITATATIPFLANIFHLVPVSSNHWLVMIGLSSVPLIMGELQKLFVGK